MHWGQRDVYAEGQNAIIHVLLHKVAEDLHDNGLIG